MKKKGLLFFSTAAVALTLAACGGKGQSSDSTTTGGTPQPKTKYASEVTHDGTPIKGGSMTIFSQLKLSVIKIIQVFVIMQTTKILKEWINSTVVKLAQFQG